MKLFRGLALVLAALAAPFVLSCGEGAPFVIEEELGTSQAALSTAPHMTAAHALYDRRGYLPQPHRDWHIDDLHLLAYRLAL